MRLIVWLLPVFGLAGCSFFETIFGGFDNVGFEPTTVVLEPVMIGGNASVSGRSEGTCDLPFDPSLPTRGFANPERDEWLAQGGAGAGIVPVSYANQVFPGAQPLPCDRWQFPILQGKVTFDFSAIPAGAVIERARLSFRALEWATRSRGFLENTRDCRINRRDDFAEISVGPAPVGGAETSGAPLRGDFPTSLRPPRGSGRTPTNVTGLVRNIVLRDLDEQQFVISPKPTVANQIHDRGTFGAIRYCALHLTEWELTVDILAPVRD